jgi:uncharacterized protein DUF4129
LNGSGRLSGLPLRPAFFAAVVLLLLGVVAAGSRADAPSQVTDTEERTLPFAFWDYAVTLGMIAIVVVVLLAVFLKVPVTSPRGRRFGFSQLLAIAVLAALVALAGTRMELPTQRGDEGVNEALVNERTEETPPQVEGESGRDARAVQLQWPTLFVGGSLILLVLGAYLVRRRLRRGRLMPLNAATALSAVLDESVDDLRAERDPRRAVIAAYARMERTLERHGLPRWAYEAPLEYLARVLRELRVRSASVLALTELFERAKFSPHVIDAEMKDEAIGALVAVRDDLGAAS